MDAFVINGGRRLSGTIRVNGSKNASLPILAAVLLTDQKITLQDIPDLADIANMLRLLEDLGCTIERKPNDTPPSPPPPPDLTIRADPSAPSHARYDIVRTMRASICVLGPLLARRGEARVSMPGGCAIGDRPVDLHLRGLEALGAQITLEAGDIVARAPASGRLKGATVFLGGQFGPTVLGTANVMSAATLAEGVTVIENAACEPEIVDLANLLNAMGAHISGAGSPRVVIEGVKSLSGATHRVMPDRIEAGTLILASAIANGQMVVTNCPIDSLLAMGDRLERVGVHTRITAEEGKPGVRSRVEISSERVLKPVQVSTHPHPGFPTDLQAQMMALLCLADGNSVITERIFPERFMHVAELSRMGASLFRQGATVVVSGVRKLVGAQVMASDLRASASLVLAGLAAEGQTTIRRVYHLDRGYENLDKRLVALGADIERVDEKTLDG